MQKDRIGIHVDDFRVGAKKGLEVAAELAFHNAEINGTSGQTAAWELSESRRHLKRFAGGLGIELVSISTDLPGLQWTDPAAVDERVSRTSSVLQMAGDMGISTVVTSIWVPHWEKDDSLPRTVVQALAQVGELADARGLSLALRPTGIAGDAMSQLLATVSCPALRVCLDPAEAVMRGINPFAGMDSLAPHIGLVYARDASIGNPERPGRETEFGAGEVDLVALLASTSAADYPGAFVLRRTESTAPADDLADARDRLKRLLA